MASRAVVCFSAAVVLAAGAGAAAVAWYGADDDQRAAHGATSTSPTPEYAPAPERSLEPEWSDPGPGSIRLTPHPSQVVPKPVLGRTLCGASFEPEGGQSVMEALRAADRRFGGMDMTRVYYPGLPSRWPGKLNGDARTTVVSFKMHPRDVLSGRRDGYMREWFRTSPRDRDVYWVYYHEPEDNIASGQFSAADYRAAWQRLRSLADRAGNKRLKATLVLMSWSLEPASKRNWREYYPGRDVIQVLGWDAYNLSKTGYQDPVEMYRRVIAVSRAEKLPFGVAETGSYLMRGDQGAERARWLRAMSRHLAKNRALWVAYFDLNWPSGDFRLRDQASIKAWRDFC